MSEEQCDGLTFEDVLNNNKSTMQLKMDHRTKGVKI